jgi:hypothetical protein
MAKVNVVKRLTIIIVLTLIVSMLITACANTPGEAAISSQGENTTAQSSASEQPTQETAAPASTPTPTPTPKPTPEPLPSEFAIGDKLIFPDEFEITMTKREFATQVNPPRPDSYYSYYEVKDSGKVYIHSIFEVKNLKGNALGADDVLDVSVLYDGKYSYTGFSTIEEDGGGDFTYTNITSIAPLTVGVLHFLVEVPVEVRDSGKNVQLSIIVNKHTLVCTGETDSPTDISFGDTSSTSGNAGASDWQKYPFLVVGETITEADYAEMTLKTAEFTNTVKPTKASGYYSYYEVKDSTKTYAHLVLEFKNLMGNGADADEIANIQVIYDNKYVYTGFSSIEEDGGSDLTYTNITRIDPLDKGTIHYIVEVPLEVRDSGKAVVFIVTFNRTSYSYTLVE